VINDVPGFGATTRRYPYNKTDGRENLFIHAPTGDACIPMMGCHWFDPLAGTPIYPPWVAGFDVYGELQFTEVMTQVPQPIYGTQWELVPAGAIPEFGNIDWFFRHVHVKDYTSGCVNVCAQNRSDCHPLASCVPDFSQSPYYQCMCPPDANIVTFNNGRGPTGCSTCPTGKIPSVDRRLCVDACSIGYHADPTGACVDTNDCPTAACASDETCLNLMGNPYACVFRQVNDVASAWTDWLMSKSLSDIANVLSPSGGVILLSFTVGKRAELILTLADPQSITDSDAANALSAASGQTLQGSFDAQMRLVVMLPATSNVKVIDARNDAMTLLATSTSVVLAVASLLF